MKKFLPSSLSIYKYISVYVLYAVSLQINNIRVVYSQVVDVKIVRGRAREVDVDVVVLNCVTCTYGVEDESFLSH